MNLHVAFLRGVGGPKPAAGDALKACLGRAGYDRIRPVMATGNVIFGLGRKRKPPSEAAISALVAGHFGYPLPAILRTGDAVTAMVGGDPFAGIDHGRLTRFVALLAEMPRPYRPFPIRRRTRATGWSSGARATSCSSSTATLSGRRT